MAHLHLCVDESRAFLHHVANIWLDSWTKVDAVTLLGRYGV